MSNALVKPVTSKEELVNIAMKGIRIESGDFGRCACGKLRQIVGATTYPTKYCTYEHGEYVFRIHYLAPEPDRQEAMKQTLQEIGCEQARHQPNYTLTACPQVPTDGQDK